ncbi:hypothetical protein BVI1335_1290004 [Burkholderia vietnamiensis]|nr:hypothetical protein BVI1335_1290004 [Burkholderia vietnamiensis]
MHRAVLRSARRARREAPQADADRHRAADLGAGRRLDAAGGRHGRGPRGRRDLLGEPHAAAALRDVCERRADLVRADRRRARSVAKLDAPHRARRPLLRRERVPGAAVAARAGHRRAGLGPGAAADPRRQRDRRAARRSADRAADRRARPRDGAHRYRRAGPRALRLRRGRALRARRRVFAARRRAPEAAGGVQRLTAGCEAPLRRRTELAARPRFKAGRWARCANAAPVPATKPAAQ